MYSSRQDGEIGQLGRTVEEPSKSATIERIILAGGAVALGFLLVVVSFACIRMKYAPVRGATPAASKLDPLLAEGKTPPEASHEQNFGIMENTDRGRSSEVVGTMTKIAGLANLK